MDKIKPYLKSDEEILWHGPAFPGKATESIVIYFFGFLISAIFIIGPAISLQNTLAKGEEDPFWVWIGHSIIVLLTGLPFLILTICSLHDRIRKTHEKEIEGNYYCLTNHRAIAYTSKDGKVHYSLLSQLANIYIENERDDYGSLHFSAIVDKQLPKRFRDKNLKVEDEFSINFDSIADIRKVEAIALVAQTKAAEEEPKTA